MRWISDALVRDTTLEPYTRLVISFKEQGMDPCHQFLRPVKGTPGNPIYFNLIAGLTALCLSSQRPYRDLSRYVFDLWARSSGNLLL